MPSTGQGPASSTVTRSTRPSSRNRWVMPIFLARMAGIWLAEGEADLDVHARGQVVEPLERVDRLGRRLVDVDEALVGPDLEVLLRVLVLEGRPDHGVDVLLGGQRDGPRHGRAGARRRLDDLLRRRLDGRVVVGLEADADLVLGGGGHRGVLWAVCGVPSAVCGEVSCWALARHGGGSPVKAGARPLDQAPTCRALLCLVELLRRRAARARARAGPRARYLIAF